MKLFMIVFAIGLTPLIVRLFRPAAKELWLLVVGEWKFLIWRVRWWKWFLGGPNIGAMHVKGYDKQTRDALLDRHDAKEPPRP